MCTRNWIPKCKWYRTIKIHILDSSSSSFDYDEPSSMEERLVRRKITKEQELIEELKWNW